MFIAQSASAIVTGPSVTGANTAVGTSIALPTHAVGDLIILCVVRDAATQPVAPTAGGTVPTWTTIDQGSATRATVMTAYCVATSTSHTSGTWASVIGLTAIVVTRQKTSGPIGGHAVQQQTSTGSAATTFPAVTLTKTDGTSIIVHCGLSVTSGGSSNWAAVPTGYTVRSQLNGTGSAAAAIVFTKDASTSDGSVTLARTGSAFQGRSGGATIEVLA